MAAGGYSRRGFLALAGAGASAAALLYWTREAVRFHRDGRPAVNGGFEGYVDRDGWMLSPSDTLRVGPAGDSR